MEYPRLITERLVIRPVARSDRDAVFLNFSNPEIAKWFFDQPFTQLEQADRIIRDFLEKAEAGTGLYWAIILVKTGEFIGTCSYEQLEANSWGKIGCDLARKHWGHGYMTEALQTIIAYGFTTLGLKKISADTYSANTKARKLLERLHFNIHSISADSHNYVLYRDDFPAKQ
ncbi:GNAT family N-acetyltransferase [bacterium]|nr:GNAT family N-acetyltransferase [bacterium]